MSGRSGKETSSLCFSVRLLCLGSLFSDVSKRSDWGMEEQRSVLIPQRARSRWDSNAKKAKKELWAIEIAGAGNRGRLLD